MNPATVKIHLQNKRTRHYYAGPGTWVEHPHQALDLVTVDNASKTYLEEQLPDAEILVDDGTLASPAVPPTPSPPCRLQA